MEFRSIEAKIRMAFFAEKGKISNNYEAYSLYKEILDYYRLSKEKLSHDGLASLEKNIAFVYYHLGRIYEKSMTINDEWHIKEKNLHDALEVYAISRMLYSKHNLNNLDKAKVLNKIEWLRYTIFLEKNNWDSINKPPKEFKIIEKIFNQSEELGNKEATVGLLNVQAAMHSFISSSPYRNIELAKSLINKALDEPFELSV